MSLEQLPREQKDERCIGMREWLLSYGTDFLSCTVFTMKNEGYENARRCFKV